MPSPLVEDPLVLRVGDGPAGTHADPDPAARADRRRIRRVHGDHRNVVSARVRFVTDIAGGGRVLPSVLMSARR